MRRISLLVSFLVALAVLGLSAGASASTSSVVISQVYAGGGNTGAAYANDFVELFNRGSSAVDVGSWTLQYASAASTSWQTIPLSGSIQPGHYYLVQLASSGAVGSALPTADAAGTTNIALSAGKLALVQGATALTCGATAGSCASASGLDDFVGYGSASDYEGGGGAAALTSSTAAFRAVGGCTDTDSNQADFSTGAPAPRNSASAAATCGVQPPPSSGGTTKDASVDVDVQPVLSISLERSTISFGSANAGETPSPISEHVTIVSNDTAGYALSVHRSAFSPHDLPLGIGASAPSGGQLGSSFGSGLVPIPIAPAADLAVGSTSAASASGGDVWPTSIGFTAPLPSVPAGHYTATVTYTVIGR
jgi:hypothetical protein